MTTVCEGPNGDIKLAILHSDEYEPLIDLEIYDPYRPWALFLIKLELLIWILISFIIFDVFSIFHVGFLLLFIVQVENDNRETIRYYLVGETMLTMLHTIGAGYVTYYMITHNNVIYPFLIMMFLPLVVKYGVVYSVSNLKLLQE